MYCLIVYINNLRKVIDLSNTNGHDTIYVQRQDELRSTVSGVWLWHVCDRAKLELTREPELCMVSSIVLFCFLIFLLRKCQLSSFEIAADRSSMVGFRELERRFALDG